MSLYASSVQIGGVPCGPVLRGSTNGEYRVVFEREHASLEEIEAIQWDPPVIVGACILPSGYGFTVTDIQYAAATRSYTVVLQVGKQYLGDVTGYTAQVSQLQEQLTEAQAETAAAQGQVTALETEAADKEAGLLAAYEEGVNEDV